VLLEPLIPGLTDTRENLSELLEALAKVGIRQVTAGYLFLRAGIQENLQPALEPSHAAEMVFHAYDEGPMLRSGTIAPARYLPKVSRQRGYALLMALAAEHGITVRLSGTSNPDFSPSRPTFASTSLRLQ